VALILAAANIMQSDIALNLSRRGSLKGNAVDKAGDPIQVEVLIFGTDINVLSDKNGYFLVENVPGGEQSVIVAYGNIAAEVDIDIDPSAENSLGVVTVPTELAIFVDE
jgi:hypothetical protein